MVSCGVVWTLGIPGLWAGLAQLLRDSRASHPWGQHRKDRGVSIRGGSSLLTQGRGSACAHPAVSLTWGAGEPRGRSHEGMGCGCTMNAGEEHEAALGLSSSWRTAVTWSSDQSTGDRLLFLPRRSSAVEDPEDSPQEGRSPCPRWRRWSHSLGVSFLQTLWRHRNPWGWLPTKWDPSVSDRPLLVRTGRRRQLTQWLALLRSARNSTDPWGSLLYLIQEWPNEQ